MGHARSLGLEDPLVGDIALAISEAVTNAVVHGFVGREPGEVSVAVEPGEDVLHVRVVDDGTGMVPRSDSPGLGLGLPTIVTLTSSFDIRAGIGGVGTEVHMVFAAPRLRAPGLTPGAPGEEERTRLLTEVAGLVGGGWPGEGVERLADLLVPDLADACAVDLVEDEEPRRLTARAALGDDPNAMTAWLAARRPREDLLVEVLAALRRGEVRITPLDDEVNRTLAHDDADLDRIAEFALAHWVNVPLLVDGVLLGSLGLGFSAARPDPHELTGFLELLGRRVADGLATTRLIEELRRTRSRLERILGALSEAVTVQGADGGLVYANEAAARLVGSDSVADMLAADAAEVTARFDITREDGSPVRLEDLPGYRLVAGGEPQSLLTRSVHRATGRESWLLTKATLIDDEERLAVNIIEDVTEAKTAELRQRFLTDVADVLASSLDLEQTLRDVSEIAVPRLADWCAVDLRDERGRIGPVAMHHRDPVRGEDIRRLRERYPVDPASSFGIAGVMRSGRLELREDVDAAALERIADDAVQLELLRSVGIGSWLVVPLTIAGSAPVGTLTLVQEQPTFDEGDVRLAEELARRAATAIANARLYSERADVAQTLQAGLLPPQLDPPPGYEIAVFFRPAGGINAVGGDFYDLVPLDGGRFLAFVGDVAGKGASAAAITARARHTLAVAAQAGGGDVRGALRRLNDALLDLADRPLVSVCCVTLAGDDRPGVVTVACAGHPPPVLVGAGEPALVDVRGSLLGAVRDAAWPEAELTLSPGESLVVYTDGATDAVGASGRLGLDGVLAALAGPAPESAEAVCTRLADAIDAFQVAEQSDDIAVLVLRRVG